LADRLSELLSENSFRIFAVTRLSVSYSKRSTKHADLQSIFTITPPIEKSAIRCTITLKKRPQINQTITLLLLLDHRY